MNAAPKCCPHCSADIIAVGPAGLCWLCRKPLSEESTAYVPPPPQAMAPSPDAPSAPAVTAPAAPPAPPLLPPAVLIRAQAPYQAVAIRETKATVVALVIGIAAVASASTLLGAGVGLAGGLVVYLAMQGQSGPMKAVNKGLLMVTLAVVAVLAAIVAFFVVCTGGLILHSAFSH